MILSAHETLSGISGSISLVAWIFVLVPQLIENYRSGSAEGISLTFLAVWFIGDIANFFGSIWADLVPTVIALAVYFCVADAVLITQCLYYHVNTRKQRPGHLVSEQAGDSSQPLLVPSSEDIGLPGSRRRSSPFQKRRSSGLAVSTLSVVPEIEGGVRNTVTKSSSVFAVCAIGALGWLVAWKAGLWKPTVGSVKPKVATGTLGAEVLGYMSAVLYLGARIPQIVKNYRDQSCEGLSLLFFILSLLGNLTYGGGILFHSTSKLYVLKNIPWLIGSLGTMIEDILVFIQFHIYERKDQLDQQSAIA